jgi:hypothetical protein
MEVALTQQSPTRLSGLRPLEQKATGATRGLAASRLRTPLAFAATEEDLHSVPPTPKGVSDALL